MIDQQFFLIHQLKKGPNYEFVLDVIIKIMNQIIAVHLVQQQIIIVTRFIILIATSKIIVARFIVWYKKKFSIL